VRTRATRHTVVVLAVFAAVPLTACGSGSAPAAVPSLSHSAAAQATGGSNSSRAAALHAAAQCIRQHGIPGYTDPVLTPGGQVYSDSRPIQDAPETVINAARQACEALLVRADLNPGNEPPAPPQLVQAGVRSAECMRAHGMPNVKDPTAQSPYTPGHGFGMSASEVPPGGKRSPVWQHAASACQSQITAEINASTLGNLGSDG
jgi:hypothetical protein